ncbi:MAG: TM1266 family iron-only hydrogenase system putative regulator [Clostridia bacterium]|nr:TM1266 family iron-only hydrogenase system putative regulator [Clostridia bacterium]
MEERVALIGILVENYNSVEKLNSILHEYREYIISRMGLPYKLKNINIISIGVDAPMDIINAITGKIGKLDGISSKTVISRNKTN